MDTTWLTRMAIVGLAIVGLMSVAVAPASAPLGAALLGGSFIGFESITTQILLVGILVTVLAVGLADRSRLAYIIASIVGLVPAAAWLYLLVTAHPTALEPVTVRLVAPSLLVLTGLGLSWPAFWQNLEDGRPDQC